MHDDQSNFSITNLLTESNKIDESNKIAESNKITESNKKTNNEDNDNLSSRNSSSASLSEDEPIVPEALAGVLNFNPSLMQQMAQNAAAFNLNLNSSAQNPNNSVTKIAPPQQNELPTTSNTVSHPEWYNAMNYLNMASRQIQFMAAGAHPGTFYSHSHSSSFEWSH